MLVARVRRRYRCESCVAVRLERCHKALHLRIQLLSVRKNIVRVVEKLKIKRREYIFLGSAVYSNPEICSLI